MVNYIFTLGFIINSRSLVLFPKNSYLAYNIPKTSPKTARVYFGMLQFSPPYKNFVLEIHTMRFVCSMLSPFLSYLLHMTFLILSFHFYSLRHVYITSLSSIHNTRTSTSEANTFLYVPMSIFSILYSI